MREKHPHEGHLLAYLEGGLNDDERQTVQAHVGTCAACRARLEQVHHARQHMAAVLDTLAPTTAEQPDAWRALSAAKESIALRRNTPTMLERLKANRPLQRALGAAGVLILLAALLALPPVQALASDFLHLFRVERFVVVSVDQQRVEQIAEALDENMFFGEQEVLEEMAEPTPVASLEEAAALAGFTPRVPQGYGDAAEILVTSAGRVRYTPDVEALRAVFETLGLDPALLPESMDGQPFDIIIPAGVILRYDDGDPDLMRDFVVMQMPSPTVEVPEGVDMQVLGEAMLQLLGMSPAEAHRLSESIDWTTTLVLPIPSDVLRVQEIGVDGTTGLLFESDYYEDGSGSAVLWQKGGIVTMISGTMSSARLLDVAAALR